MKSSVDDIAQRFATAHAEGVSRVEVRDLVNDLVLAVLGALRNAPLAEIAETLRELEAAQRSSAEQRARRLKESRAELRRASEELRATAHGEPGRTPISTTSATKTIGRARVRPLSAIRNGAPSGGAHGDDAFDITMPGELLDTASRQAPRQEEQPPSSVRPAFRRATSVDTNGATRSSQAEGSADAPAQVEATEPAPAPLPTVPLRDGEQLLRASGAGVIIRRVRTA